MWSLVSTLTALPGTRLSASIAILVFAVIHESLTVVFIDSVVDFPVSAARAAVGATKASAIRVAAVITLPVRFICPSPSRVGCPSTALNCNGHARGNRADIVFLRRKQRRARAVRTVLPGRI